jgi:hypothetical protein
LTPPGVPYPKITNLEAFIELFIGQVQQGRPSKTKLWRSHPLLLWPPNPDYIIINVSLLSPQKTFNSNKSRA